MLNIRELKEKALNECIQMIGEDLFMEHKDLCCASYGMNDDGTFEYILGMDTVEAELAESTIIIAEDPMEYYAFVYVDPKTGVVKRDYINSILPN